MSPRRPSPLTVLRAGTLLQATILVPVGLAWLWVPVRETRSALSPRHDPTADLGPWAVPILLGLAGLCVLAAGACLIPGVVLPLSARRLPRRWALRTLIALEAVAWLAPLVRADVPRTPQPGALSVTLAVLGAVVVALAAHPSIQRRIPSPGAAPRVPHQDGSPGHPPTRRH